MHKNINNLNFEIKIIMKNLRNFFSDRDGLISNLIEERFSREDLYYYPQITLISDLKASKADNTVSVLAALNLLMYISTQLHHRVPENSTYQKLYYDEFQLPILVGDLLYSKLFNILCEHDLIEYIDLYVQYVEPLNLTWINYLENKCNLEELCLKKYGELGRLAALTGIKNSQKPEGEAILISECGFALGNLFGARKMLLPKEFTDQQLSSLDYLFNELGLSEYSLIALLKANKINQKIKEISFPQKVALNAVASN